MARKILSEEALRKRLVDLCPVIYRAAMASILDLTLLRLMSCSYLLLPDKIGRSGNLIRTVKIFPDYSEIQKCRKLVWGLILFFPAELCKEQMRLHLLDVGSWIRFPETVHELYAHLPQFIGNFFLQIFNCSIKISNNYRG